MSTQPHPETGFNLALEHDGVLDLAGNNPILNN